MPFASRITDGHACAIHPPNVIASASSNVRIGGLLAARLMDTCACGAPIVKGSMTVQINGRSAIRVGDPTGHGGTIVGFCPTVNIGG
jgi:uncharacterized Zn-binding protein involved in type VI secretion